MKMLTLLPRMEVAVRSEAWLSQARAVSNFFMDEKNAKY